MPVIGFLEQSKLILFSFSISFPLNFILSKLAYSHEFLDIPFERKAHLFPVALGGGVALFLSLTLSSMILGGPYELLVFSSLLLVMGLIDDLFDLPAVIKLLLQIVISSLWLIYTRLVLLGNPLIDLLGGVLWLVALTNAFNIIDGIDGLASGIAILTSLGLALEGESFALLITGASLGFFILNYPPAKIFLGDAGAYLLGFLIGSLSLGFLKEINFPSVIKLFFMVSFPLIDITWAVLRRWIKGQPAMVGDDKHIHHLLKRKFGGKLALLILLVAHGVSVFVGVWFF